MPFSNYLTPQELINLYPQVKLLGWSSSKVGTFFSSGLLLGYRSGKEYKALILEPSFQELMDYANVINDKRRIRY